MFPTLFSTPTDASQLKFGVSSAGGLFGSTTGLLFGQSKPQEKEQPKGSIFGGSTVSLFGAPKTQEKAPAQPTASVFGSGIFGAGSSLFGTSTLQPGGFGATVQATNPFASYNLANAGKKQNDSDESGDEDAAEEKRPPSPETFKVNAEKSKAEGQKVPAMSLEPSPYTKLISVNIS